MVAMLACASSATSKPSSEYSDLVDSSRKAGNFFANYLNPYISPGLGFDHALYFPSVGLKSGRLLLQGGYSFLQDKQQLTLNGTIDFSKSYITNHGYYRLNLGFSYSEYDEDFNNFQAAGLLFGFNTYFWNGRTSLHGKIGLAATPTRTAFGQTPESDYRFFPVAALGFNFYALRLRHGGVE